MTNFFFGETNLTYRELLIFIFWLFDLAAKREVHGIVNFVWKSKLLIIIFQITWAAQVTPKQTCVNENYLK